MWLFCCPLKIIKAHRLQGMDEFGNRCHERLIWGFNSREVSLVTLWAGTSPASSHPLALSHWRNFSGTTYLKHSTLPGSAFQRGWEGQGSKLASEAMKGEKQLQMANKADSSANGKANPYSHPACTFAGKTSGCIDFRLQYKLYSLNYI